MLHPFLMVTVLYIIFSNIFSRFVENYSAYIICGILVWQFYAQSTARGSRVLYENAGIIKKAYMPLSVFPLSAVLSAAINLMLALVSGVAFMLVVGVPISSNILLLPLCLMLLIMLSLGVSLVLSTVSIYFPDILHMYEVALLVLMYLSAIFYPISIVPETFQIWIELNPVYHFVSLVRSCIYGDSFTSFLYYFLTCSAISVPIVVLGLTVHYRNKTDIIYYL